MITLIYHSSTKDLSSLNETKLFFKPIRLKNIELDVTGLLLHHEGKIMQILEGEKEIITSLFERIKLDNRHTDVVKLIDFEMIDRSYEEWSMASTVISDAESLHVAGYLNIYNEKVCPQQTFKSSYLQMLINSFIEENVN